MRDFQLFVHRWVPDTEKQEVPTADGPRKRYGLKKIWSGQQENAPTLNELREKGIDMPAKEIPQCSCVCEQHVTYTYEIIELIDGKLTPNPYDQKRYKAQD